MENTQEEGETTKMTTKKKEKRRRRLLLDARAPLCLTHTHQCAQSGRERVKAVHPIDSIHWEVCPTSGMQVRISGVLFRKGEQKGETGEKEAEEENITLLFKKEIQRRGTTGGGLHDKIEKRKSPLDS